MAFPDYFFARDPRVPRTEATRPGQPIQMNLPGMDTMPERDNFQDGRWQDNNDNLQIPGRNRQQGIDVLDLVDTIQNANRGREERPHQTVAQRERGPNAIPQRGIIVGRPEIRFLRTSDTLPTSADEPLINVWLRNWNIRHFISWLKNPTGNRPHLLPGFSRADRSTRDILGVYWPALLESMDYATMGDIEELWAGAIGQYIMDYMIVQDGADIDSSIVSLSRQENIFVSNRPMITHVLDTNTGMLFMKIEKMRVVNLVIERYQCSDTGRYDEIKNTLIRAKALLLYSNYFNWIRASINRSNLNDQMKTMIIDGMKEALLPSYLETGDRSKLYLFGIPIDNPTDVNYNIFDYDKPDPDAITFDIRLKIRHNDEAGMGITAVIIPTGDTPPPSRREISNEMADNPGVLRTPASIVRDAQAEQACTNALISADFIATAEAHVNERGVELAESNFDTGINFDPSAALNITATNERSQEILDRLRILTAPIEPDEEIEDPAALIVSRNESYLMGPGGSYVRATDRSVNISGIMFRNEAAIKQGQGQVSGQDIENPMRNILPASNVFTPIIPYIANIFLFIDLGLNVYNLGKFIHSTVQYFIARARRIDEGAKDIPYNMIVRYDPDADDELDVPDLGIGQTTTATEWEVDPNDPTRMHRTVTVEEESYDERVERVFGKSCSIQEEMITSMRRDFEEQYPASITRCNIMGFDKWKDVREAQYKRYKNRLAREEARREAAKQWYGGIPGGDPLIQIQDPAGGAIFDFSRETLVSCTLTAEEKNRLRELYSRDPSVINRIEDEGLFNMPDEVLGDTNRVCSNQVREYLTSLAGNCKLSDDVVHTIARSLARGKQPKDITAAELGLAGTCDGAVKERAKEIAKQYDLLQESGEATEAENTVPDWVRSLIRS